MKRLRYYLLNMRPASETYEEMYEGKMYETCGDNDPVVHNHALYWDGEIGYEITKSNRLELSKPTVTLHIPLKLLGLEEAGLAALDYIFRGFLPYIRALNELNDNRKRPYKENGHYFIYEPGNKILVRNVIALNTVAQKYYKILRGNTVESVDGLESNGKSCIIVPIDGEREVPAYLCASIMLQVQLPVGKHKKAVQMLTRDLPEAVNCFVQEFDLGGLRRALELFAKQQAIRTWLKEGDYCAFVANGSILPREKGSDAPMQGAVPFRSTPEDEVEVAGVRGMAFKKGVTVITGGGYSGKSTLLDALSAGIYNHVEGDGRELVITDDSAMKISAEDGRCIRHVNLSPFIKWILGGNPRDFSTEHASGSTSQAANIMEAIGWGVKLLMIDEDKSATNFMIQDYVMKTLIEKEPITPFVERVQELAMRRRVSTILVIGGSSEYLQAADRIYMMKDYHVSQVTAQAKELQARFVGGVGRDADRGLDPADFTNRDEIDARCLSTRPEGSATEVLRVSDLGFLILGEQQIDIRMLHDIATLPQLNAIAFLIRKLINRVNPLERFQKFRVATPGRDAMQGDAVLFEEAARAEGTILPEGGAWYGKAAKAEGAVRLEGDIRAEDVAASVEDTAPRWICREKEVERLLEEMESSGLESVYAPFFTECARWMDLPRKYEILAVLSRMRL